MESVSMKNVFYSIIILAFALVCIGVCMKIAPFFTLDQWLLILILDLVILIGYSNEVDRTERRKRDADE